MLVILGKLDVLVYSFVRLSIYQLWYLWVMEYGRSIRNPDISITSTSIWMYISICRTRLYGVLVYNIKYGVQHKYAESVFILFHFIQFTAFIARPVISSSRTRFSLLFSSSPSDTPFSYHFISFTFFPFFISNNVPFPSTMWRRTYLLLLVIRVYFALSPSYLHPDENFQGPELFAGVFNNPMIA